MTSERNPLAGREGWLVDMLESLDDADVAQYIVYWEARWAELRARGDGYGGWWCSKHVSAGMAEQRRRRP